MRDLARQQELALEALLDLHRGGGIVGRVGTDDLQRDRHTELGVPGLVDDAHAAGAELAQDAVAGAELRTRLEARERASP